MFFSYSMSICLRYAENKEEAQEILNDAFMKVFGNLSSYQGVQPFRFWLRRILINTAIDHYRKNKSIRLQTDIGKASSLSSDTLDILDEIGEQEILQLVQELPPAYKLVFNLYVIEGYNHREIAEMLGIQEGTSKSNLAKARMHLQAKIKKLYAFKSEDKV